VTNDATEPPFRGDPEGWYLMIGAQRREPAPFISCPP
jgi:hypothetical protein